ncbi:hypothetical protein [Priestia flexa]|uniref:hypothetical protein n=1 Tax=Priestia flexa TaxID=86664 RepID=UPI00047322A5|nr:hypothetical protein [Priestia flexa]
MNYHVTKGYECNGKVSSSYSYLNELCGNQFTVKEVYILFASQSSLMRYNNVHLNKFNHDYYNIMLAHNSAKQANEYFDQNRKCIDINQSIKIFDSERKLKAYQLRLC